MKRTLIYGLAFIALAAWLGALIARHPGYVLLTWGDYTMQTSLWVMLVLVVLALVPMFAALRLLRWFAGAPMVYGNWRAARRQHRDHKLTAQGLTLLHEGEFERAGRYLQAGANTDLIGGINYLAAARVADHSGETENREKYLRQAQESDPALATACQVTRLELAVNRGDFADAAGLLDGLKLRNPRILRLRQQVQLGLKRHEEMLKLVPELARVSKDDARQYEIEAALIGLEAAADDAARTRLFKSLSSHARQEVDLLLACVERLDDKAQAEPLLRAALRKGWHESLALAYGELADTAPNAHKKDAYGKQVTAWAAEHEDSPALQYCLGRMYEAAGDREQAVAAYAKSVELGQVSAANLRLADIYSAEGELGKANRHLTSALAANS